MRCNYPNCYADAKFLPVLYIPTIRTKALIYPELSPLIKNAQLMAKNELDFNMTVRLYEAALAAWKSEVNDLIETADPTIYLGRELCLKHRLNFQVHDWFSRSDWEAMVEAARAKGVVLETKDLEIKWEAVGWTPGHRYTELERSGQGG